MLLIITTTTTVILSAYYVTCTELSTLPPLSHLYSKELSEMGAVPILLTWRSEVTCPRSATERQRT